MRSLALTLLIVALLAGCQTLRTYPRSWRPLAPPIAQHHQSTRLLTLRWADQVRHYHCTLITSPDHTRIIARTADGALVFRLHQTRARISIERTPLLPPRVSPDVILADLQLMLWPASTLEQSLPQTLYHQDDFRKLYSGHTLEARVIYQGKSRWQDPAILINDRYQYQLILQALPDEPTSPSRATAATSAAATGGSAPE